MTIAEWIDLLAKLPDEYTLCLGDRELTPEDFRVLDDEGRVVIIAGRRSA